MTESLAKATHGIGFVIDDLKAAMKAAQVQRPEGPSLADKVMLAYLAECLDVAHTLHGRLLNIA